MSLASPNLTTLRAFDGPMTSELVRTPAAFGLGQVPARVAPVATKDSVCGFCATGCSLRVHLDAEGKAVNLTPNLDYTVNQGMACPKGWEALAILDAPDRATTPLLRDAQTGKLEAISWEQAMDVFCRRMRDVQSKHGAHSVAVLSTGQIVTEEMAFLGALSKFGLGLRHVDSNTRQCMATSHVAYKQSFGFDAPPYTYKDFEESDCIVLIGSNLAIAHPIMWQRVMMNRRNPEIVVVDPRRTETAMLATQHYGITPKSDLRFLYAIAHVLVREGWVKRDFVQAHTSGFEVFEEFLRAYSPASVAAACGISADRIEALARLIHEKERVSFWWTMGVNQSHESTRTAQAIINLALMTGNIGRPGTGANSITGQCNAMGSRLYAHATSLPAGRDFLKPEDRAEVARILNIPENRVPTENSWAYDQIIDGIETGAIRGLWVVATNTAHSWIHQKRAQELLAKLDFLVVQDMYATTETAQMAHLILPAAGWGEKEGTFINSERRIGRAKKVARAPGEALADFQIFRLIAEAWRCGDLFREWKTPEAAFQILKRLSVGRPCDISGIRDYAHLDELAGVQWPVPSGENVGRFSERRLFADGKFFTADQRAKFLFDEPRAPAEKTSGEYPFVLLTGRGSSAQWHTLTRTNKSQILRKLAPETAYVEICAADAERLGIVAQQEVRVVSARASVRVRAAISESVAPGQCYMAMHFIECNQLTKPSFDPHSRQPSYKHCAVRIESGETSRSDA